MQTDIPLKRLTTLRAHDLLPLLRSSDATVVAVETLELPATATRLANVLRLRSAGGQEYLHVVERPLRRSLRLSRLWHKPDLV